MSSSEVIFRPKSSWQKDNCLFCSREAMLEAVYGVSLIRCCDGEGCKQHAAKLAKDADSLLSKK